MADLYLKRHWNCKDITGRRFGMVVVIGVSNERRGVSKRVVWTLRCDCGNAHSATTSDLTAGSVRSCGCNQHAGHRVTHGQSGSRAFNIWLAMKQRCLNPRHHAYRLYGGRGIRVCDRWLESFENFLADMGHPPNGMSIDRYPNMDGNYEPDNCRWATAEQQAKNSNRNVLITYNGKTQNISDWARELRTSNSNLCRRIRVLGIPLALTAPIVRRNRGRTILA